MKRFTFFLYEILAPVIGLIGFGVAFWEAISGRSFVLLWIVLIFSILISVWGWKKGRIERREVSSNGISNTIPKEVPNLSLISRIIWPAVAIVLLVILVPRLDFGEALLQQEKVDDHHTILLTKLENTDEAATSEILFDELNESVAVIDSAKLIYYDKLVRPSEGGNLKALQLADSLGVKSGLVIWGNRFYSGDGIFKCTINPIPPISVPLTNTGFGDSTIIILKPELLNDIKYCSEKIVCIAKFVYAQLLFREGKYQQTINTLKSVENECVGNDSGNYYNRLFIGISYDLSGRADSARYWYQKAQRSTPFLQGASNDLESIKREHPKKKMEDAFAFGSLIDRPIPKKIQVNPQLSKIASLLPTKPKEMHESDNYFSIIQDSFSSQQFKKKLFIKKIHVDEDSVTIEYRSKYWGTKVRIQLSDSAWYPVTTSASPVWSSSTSYFNKGMVMKGIRLSAEHGDDESWKFSKDLFLPGVRYMRLMIYTYKKGHKGKPENFFVTLF